MRESQSARVERAHASIRQRVGPPCGIALMLGSGLGHIADSVAGAEIIPYSVIDGFPVSTAPGHKGQLVAGTLFGRRVLVMQGRLHLYEGWAPADIALSVYLLKRLGAASLIVTNAAGALNPNYAPGEVMLIEDHLNFTGLNPLVGPNDDSIGLRFPDMSRAYDPALLKLARKAADESGTPVHTGIYAGVLGPSLETSAERRFLRAAGADAVGMSTVTEVIAAVHAGLRVVGISAITNKATGGPEQEPDTLEDVLANAAVAGEKIAGILERLLPAMPNGER